MWRASQILYTTTRRKQRSKPLAKLHNSCSLLRCLERVLTPARARPQNLRRQAIPGFPFIFVFIIFFYYYLFAHHYFSFALLSFLNQKGYRPRTDPYAAPQHAAPAQKQPLRESDKLKEGIVPSFESTLLSLSFQ